MEHLPQLTKFKQEAINGIMTFVGTNTEISTAQISLLKCLSFLAHAPNSESLTNLKTFAIKIEDIKKALNLIIRSIKKDDYILVGFNY